MKPPLPSVTEVLVVPVGTFTIVTVAPATGAPPAVTEPRIVEVVSCAIAATGTMSAAAATPRSRLLRIYVSPIELFAQVPGGSLTDCRARACVI